MTWSRGVRAWRGEEGEASAVISPAHLSPAGPRVDHECSRTVSSWNPCRSARKSLRNQPRTNYDHLCHQKDPRAYPIAQISQIRPRTGLIRWPAPGLRPYLPRSPRPVKQKTPRGRKNCAPQLLSFGAEGLWPWLRTSAPRRISEWDRIQGSCGQLGLGGRFRSQKPLREEQSLSPPG